MTYRGVGFKYPHRSSASQEHLRAHARQSSTCTLVDPCAPSLQFCRPLRAQARQSSTCTFSLVDPCAPRHDRAPRVLFITRTPARPSPVDPCAPPRAIVRALRKTPAQLQKAWVFGLYTATTSERYLKSRANFRRTGKVIFGRFAICATHLCAAQNRHRRIISKLMPWRILHVILALKEAPPFAVGRYAGVETCRVPRG